MFAANSTLVKPGISEIVLLFCFVVLLTLWNLIIRIVLKAIRVVKRNLCGIELL